MHLLTKEFLNRVVLMWVNV